MRNRTQAFITATLAALAFTASACDSQSSSGSAPKTVNAQAQGNNNENQLASHFANAPKNPFLSQDPPDPLELKNLSRRLLQLNAKGSTGYVYLLTPTGQAIGYWVISGKVSSTGSQMTSTQGIHNCMSGSSQDGGSCAVTDSMGDDGSYGPSEGGPNGVFWFTATGALVETADPYWVYSAQPIKLYANAPQLETKA